MPYSMGDKEGPIYESRVILIICVIVLESKKN